MQHLCGECSCITFFMKIWWRGFKKTAFQTNTRKESIPSRVEFHCSMQDLHFFPIKKSGLINMLYVLVLTVCCQACAGVQSKCRPLLAERLTVRFNGACWRSQDARRLALSAPRTSTDHFKCQFIFFCLTLQDALRSSQGCFRAGKVHSLKDGLRSFSFF